jgi:hypothetical protein
MSDELTTTKPKRRMREKKAGSIFKRNNSRFWWIAYGSGGKRRFESTHSEKKGDAVALLTSRTGDVQRGIAVTPQMGKLTLGKGLEAVFNDLKMNRRKSAQQTKRRYEQHILLRPAEGKKSASGFFPAERLMNSISTADIERYKTHRFDEKAKPATINRELAVIRRAFRLAVDGGNWR